MQAKTPPALGFSTDRVLDWSEISQHRSRESAWMVLRNKVFDITDYLSLHPGGSDILLRFCGQDATTQFNAAHPWVHFESIIGHRQVGVLPTSEH